MRSFISPRIRYNTLAEHYDDHYSGSMGKAEEVVSFSYISPYVGNSILDVGCGTSLILEYFNPDFYYGIDLSVLMIEKAKVKFPNAHYASRNFEQPFMLNVGNLYDTVICWYALSYSLNPRQTLFEISNHLAPKGKAIFGLQAPSYYSKRASYINHGSGVPFMPYSYDMIKPIFTQFFTNVTVQPFNAYLELVYPFLSQRLCEKWLRWEMRVLGT